MALAAVTLCGSACLFAQSSEKLNVVVLLVDDLGQQDIGAYNPTTFYETPNIDRLAAEGTLFTSGYAANPVCSPTRYSVMTGKYPTRAALTNWLPGKRTEKFAGAPLATHMASEETTIAEALRKEGYRTAFVGKWHLGESEADWPEAQGFEFNFGGFSMGRPSSYFSPYKNPRLKDGPTGEYLPERLVRESVGLLRKFKTEGKPFLLVHSFYLVHGPLQAPASLIEKYKRKAEAMGLKPKFGEDQQYHYESKQKRRVRESQDHATYAAMMEALDTSVGVILSELKALSLDKNTLVVFLSDNGGLSTAEGSPTANLPLRGGKGWVYEGGIRVPFIVRHPTRGKAGLVNDVPVITNDLMPTLLAAAGAKPSPETLVDGISLLPLVEKEVGALRERPLFWHYPHYSNQGGFPGGAIRVGQWKLVEDYEDGSVALYDLANDIGERNDLAAAQPERVKNLRSQLHSWYKTTGAKFLGTGKLGLPAWSPDN